MHLSGFDNELAGERAERIRAEVARGRLEARTRRDARSEADGDGVVSRGRVARVAAVARVLFGLHPTA